MDVLGSPRESIVEGSGVDVKGENEVWVDWVSVTMAYPARVGATADAELRGQRLKTCLREPGARGRGGSRYPVLLPPGVSLSDDRVSAGRGYNRAYLLEPAGYVAWHGERVGQKIHVTFKGSEIGPLLAVSGWDERGLMGWASGHNVTRVDFAFDVHDADALAEDCYNAVLRDEVVTRVQRRNVLLQKHEVAGVGSDATVYFGSTGSEKRLRVYDKSVKESGARGMVRVELQLRGSAARGAVKRVAAGGLVPLVGGLIRDFVDCPTVGWWAAAFAGVSAVGGYAEKAEVGVFDVERLLRAVRRGLASEAGEDVQRLLKAALVGHQGDVSRPSSVEWQYELMLRHLDECAAVRDG